MVSFGSWKGWHPANVRRSRRIADAFVRLTVKGTQGQGTISVPVPMAALSTKSMQTGLRVMLAFLLVLLVASMVAIIGAGVWEGRLPRGVLPDGWNVRRGRGAMAIALAVLTGIVWLGRQWWDSTAADYAQRIYKPLQTKASLESGNVVTLRMIDPGSFQAADGRIGDALIARRMDDLIPDHDHLMHLYAIREPGLDIVFHLHPEQVEVGLFRLALPTMPAGVYSLYADVVHETGFPETLVASLKIPAMEGRALTGDDAEGDGWPWQSGTSTISFNLPDGFRMEWLRDDLPLRAKVPGIFRFRLLDPLGQPAHMSLYMGIIGHAAFLKTDGTAFAHIHPAGSVSMAALALAQRGPNGGSGLRPVSIGDGMQMPGMDHTAMPMTGFAQRRRLSLWISECGKISNFRSDEARQNGRDGDVRC